MIIGELTFVDQEFLIDIQDMNFLSTSNANIETLTNNSTFSLFNWSSTTPSGRVSAQSMANNKSSENSINTSQDIENNKEFDSNDEDLTTNIQESNSNNENLAGTSSNI